MPFARFTGAEQITMLRRIFQVYCVARGITAGRERDEAAALIMSLYLKGATSQEALIEALAAVSDPGQTLAEPAMAGSH